VLYRCKICAGVFIPEFNFKPVDFYDKHYFKGSDSKGYQNYKCMENSLRKTFIKRINKIEEKHKITGKDMLDFGCGMGFFLSEARKKGYRAAGIEVSDYAAGYCRTKYGFSILNNINDIDKNFDIITMWDVIEHLEDPLNILSRVHDIMTADGLLVITTGNIDSAAAKLSGKKWHLFNIPEHLSYFSPKSIKYLLEKTGFKIRQIKYESSYYQIPYIVERLSKSLFGSTDNFFLKISRNLKFFLPVNLFDIMTIYAGKGERDRIATGKD
jgi:2-polyprenyl-3-methyl-5-hydroxy-6-metoxy-1,4-benzoquinol methylase